MKKQILLLIITLTGYLSNAQRADVFYGKYTGFVYLNDQLKSKCAVTCSKGNDPDKIIFDITIYDEAGTNQQTRYVADYTYFEKKTNIADFSFTQTVPGKKGGVKGRLYFNDHWHKSGRRLIIGVFRPNNNKDQYTKMKWDLYSDQLYPILEYTPTSQLVNTIVTDESAFSDFREGYTIIKKGKEYTMMNFFGLLHPAFPPEKYDLPHYDTWTDHNGQPRLNNCGFRNGVSIVRNPQTGKYGFVDTAGNIVVSCILSSAAPFMEDGYGWGSISDPKTRKQYGFFFDRQGNRYPDNNVGAAGLYFYTIREIGQKNYTVYRKNGTLAFETPYYPGTFSEGLFPVRNYEATRKVGFLDSTGKLAIPFVFDDAPSPFSEGIARLDIFKGQYQGSILYDLQGKQVLQVNPDCSLGKISRIDNYLSGYFWCRINGREGKVDAIMDIDGNFTTIKALIAQSNSTMMDDLKGSIDEALKVEVKSRDEFGLYVNCTFDLKPATATGYVLDHGEKQITGGVGGGDEIGYRVSGCGMIDYQGNFLMLPYFHQLDPIDPISQAGRVTVPSKIGTIEAFSSTFGELNFCKKRE